MVLVSYSEFDSATNGNQTGRVSVIVPVFNSARYLSDCVESLLDIDYPSYEVILVDDGSTDGSAEICDQFREKQPSVIRVVHQENAGPAVARNRGVELSRGDYIMFVDSDDVVRSDILSVLVDALRNSKAAIVRFPLPTFFAEGERFESKGHRAPCGRFEVFCSEDAARKILYQEWECGPVLGAASKELIKECPFPDAVIGEDLYATLDSVSKCERVAFVRDRGLYGCRILSSGLTRGGATRRKADSAIIVSRLLWTGPASHFPDLFDAFSARCFSLLRMVFAQVGFRSDEARILFSEMRKYRRAVLFDRNGRIRERIASAISCLGFVPFSVFCKLCRRFGLMR